MYASDLIHFSSVQFLRECLHTCTFDIYIALSVLRMQATVKPPTEKSPALPHDINKRAR